MASGAESLEVNARLLDFSHGWRDGDRGARDYKELHGVSSAKR